MKWIFGYNKKYIGPYIITNVLSIFFSSIDFIVPILIGFLCDCVLIYHNYEFLVLFSILIVVFALLKYCGSYLSLVKIENLSEKIISNLKLAAYENINQLDHYFFEHNNKGELMTNFTSDMWQIRRHISYNIRTIGSIIVTFSFSLIYLLSINAFFTIMLLTPGLIIGLISFVFVRKMKKEYELLREKIAVANDYVSDNIEGNHVVKTFALEQKEIKEMQKINEDYVTKDIAVGCMENNFFAKVDFLSWITDAIFLILGGYFFIQNQITLGELIIYNSYLYNLRSPFTRLSGLLNSIQRYIIAQKRIHKLILAKGKFEHTGKEKVNSLLLPIEFQNVQIVFDNRVVVDNLNLKIKPYETIAFIGKTGSGKSSIANLLLGLIVPSQGKILIDGKDFLTYDIKDIRNRIGYMSQQAFLFSDTIYNNIAYGNMKISEKEAYHYADLACCDYVYNLPNKINTVIGEKGVGLSGGEKQRLALARGLAVKPDLLLLDDITSALDIETEEKINESIATLPHKATKIIIASKIVSVKNADHIYVLENGKVVEHGKHQTLLKKKGYYYELYKIQKGDI